MIYISHRGNISCVNREKENSPEYIVKALDLGFYVEIDLFKIGNDLFLGHDEPKNPVGIDFFKENYAMLWIHCKNFEALNYFSGHKEINYFWHENDKFTLTSQNIIWTYPEQTVGEKSVIVCQTLEQTEKYFTADCWGICTDYVNEFLQ